MWKRDKGDRCQLLGRALRSEKGGDGPKRATTFTMVGGAGLGKDYGALRRVFADSALKIGAIGCRLVPCVQVAADGAQDAVSC